MIEDKLLAEIIKQTSSNKTLKFIDSLNEDVKNHFIEKFIDQLSIKRDKTSSLLDVSDIFMDIKQKLINLENIDEQIEDLEIAYRKIAFNTTRFYLLNLLKNLNKTIIPYLHYSEKAVDYILDLSVVIESKILTDNGINYSIPTQPDTSDLYHKMYSKAGNRRKFIIPEIVEFLRTYYTINLGKIYIPYSKREYYKLRGKMRFNINYYNPAKYLIDNIKYIMRELDIPSRYYKVYDLNINPRMGSDFVYYYIDIQENDKTHLLHTPINEMMPSALESALINCIETVNNITKDNQNLLYHMHKKLITNTKVLQIFRLFMFYYETDSFIYEQDNNRIKPKN